MALGGISLREQTNAMAAIDNLHISFSTIVYVRVCQDYVGDI